MRRVLACLLIGALAGCGSPADRQLEAVKSARSVLAEWALVEERDARARAPAVYVEQMRKQAREQLKTTQSELKGQPQAAGVIERVRTGSPNAAALTRANKALEPLEHNLESA